MWTWSVDPLAHAVRASGLRSAVKKGGGSPRLSSKTGDEILSLQRGAQEAHPRYLLSVEPKAAADPVARGRFIVGEIAATLAWLFDDGVDDAKDAQLENVTAAHADDPETTDALASALDDFAGLAEPHGLEQLCDGPAARVAAAWRARRGARGALARRPSSPERAPPRPRLRNAAAPAASCWPRLARRAPLALSSRRLPNAPRRHAGVCPRDR